MPRWLVNLFVAVLIIAIPPLLVLSNVFVFMTPQYLLFEYDKPDFPRADLFSDKDRRYYASESIEYIRGNRTFEQFKGLGVYNERELKHMIDVRVLVDASSRFLLVDGLIALAALVALAWTSSTRPLAARGLFRGAALTVVLLALVGLFAGAAFNTFFVYFHRVFFEGDTWLFLYTDSLIQFYPTRFWFDTALLLSGLTVVEALVLGAIGWAWTHIISFSH